MEESSDDSDSMETSYKLTVVARTDLSMSAGKLASQVGHAVAETFRGADAKVVNLWQEDGGMIVVLQASTEDTLLKLQKSAKREAISTWPVYDHGLTEVSSGTLTTLAVGPDEVSRVNTVTGHLQLLRDMQEAEVEKLRERNAELDAKNAELELKLREIAAGAVAPILAAASQVWFSRCLNSRVEQAVCPEMFEMWTWEGDSTVLPSKWEEAVQECCGGEVLDGGHKPWQSKSFDEQGIFFITSRSETCGVAVALPYGSDGKTGTIGALGVKPWCRRRGIGRCLLRLCMQRHKELGRTDVKLVCSTTDPKLFLESEGFLQT